MSNKIQAKSKKKVNVYDLIPAAYHTWDSKTQASWCVKNAVWLEEEGFELEAPGIDVRFEGNTIIIEVEEAEQS